MQKSWRVTLALGIALAGAITASGSANAVTGGSDVTNGTMPYVARLDMGTLDRSCTGVLVHPQVVLTAAVCFAGKDGTATSGKPPLATKVTLAGIGDAVTTVRAVTIHPDRNIALARLETVIGDVTPVAFGAAPADGEVLTLAGYGRTNTAWNTGKLRAAEFTVKSTASSTFSVSPSGEPAGICKGDAGGPALRRVGDAYQLVGLHHTSNQAGCVGEAAGTPLATETRLDDVRAWVTAGLPSFSSGFETSDVRPNWRDTVSTGKGHGGSANITGLCCSVTVPELAVRSERPHGGANTLLYSGKSTTSTANAYAYLRAFSLRNVKLRPSSVLSYWIYPQTTATSSYPTGTNSSCVAVDVVFTDGTNLRDNTAVKDQNGNPAHPSGRCGKLTMDRWNEVVIPIGTIGAGKLIDTVNVGYDQPKVLGGYRGYIDDIKISDVIESSQFSTGLETGEPALTWTNTATTPVVGGSGGLANVGGLCCGATGPELDARTERAYGGTSALLYSGKDNSSTSNSHAYLKGFQLNNVFVRPTTKLTYRIFPQGAETTRYTSGSNSTCVSVDLLFVDLWDNNMTNMRDASAAVDQNGNRAHPAAQCQKLNLDKWNEVTISLAPMNGRQITQVDIGYDQLPNMGGYRGYIDDIRISE
jgi:hypothetical protein